MDAEVDSNQNLRALAPLDTSVWAFIGGFYAYAISTKFLCAGPYNTRPPNKSVLLKISFLISQPKHMLWVLKRTVSMRRFF